MSRSFRLATAEIKQDRVDSTYEEFDELHQDAEGIEFSHSSKQVINIISNPATANPSPKAKKDSNTGKSRILSGHKDEPSIDNPTSYMLETDSVDQEIENGNEGNSTDLLPGSRSSRDLYGSSNYSFDQEVDLNGTANTMFMLPKIKSAPLVQSKAKNITHRLINSAGFNERKDDSEVLSPDSFQPLNDVSYLTKSTNDVSAAKTKTAGPKSAGPKSAGVNDQPWESAIPALLYSNSFSEGKGKTPNTTTNHNEISRQALQETLIRKNSIISQNEIDLIRVSLSRSRSVISKKQLESSKDSTPLLFSQTKESSSNQVTRSNTIKKEENKTQLESNSTDKFEDAKIEKRDHEKLSEDDDEEISSSSQYNPLTVETELNCLKPKDPYKQEVKKNSFFQIFTPPFKNFYKAEDPVLNKMTGKNFWSRQSGDLSGLLKKNERFQYIIIWVLFVFLMASLCTFIPFIIIYSRGTDSSVRSYLSNITPEHRNELLKEYLTSINSYDPTFSHTPSQPRPISLNQTESKKLIVPDLSANIAGITKFSQLPEKYQNNDEIRAVMNQTNLKNVFYGIDYAPRNVIYPICGVTLHDVILDVALLSQVTSRIRTYGTQCNQAKFILDSIKALNLNVSLALGVWIGRDDYINSQQMDDMKALLKSYPREYFESLYIGNEVLFREEQTPSGLAKYINEAKSFVVNDLKWNLPVGTSELGSKTHLEVMMASDIFGSNTHPFFNGDNVQNATQWVYDFVDYNVEPFRQEVLNKRPGSSLDLVISEVGWPYQGGTYNNAVAGKRQMQYFLNHWICESNKKNMPWFFFEAFDEPWKSVYHRDGAKWETEWGIFTADRQLKEGIVFPTC